MEERGERREERGPGTESELVQVIQGGIEEFSSRAGVESRHVGGGGQHPDRHNQPRQH